ncbi:glutathione S-transferase family protein [filamentous cyanobacterium LEGE 11480]|uniref:Glutathione S-transferase family protein n=1 Tax=Romeriopsis navalis LEGE 11480 TaxID=2777977 RepID=A0A928Z5J6_9CYAN|nr:glutathione S-transferase family protein [Romeriopsis navalis]MBE9031340.1 glutathione S-transferase family protein [Romeriopsis navalis LEGE 11480]
MTPFCLTKKLTLLTLSIVGISQAVIQISKPAIAQVLVPDALNPEQRAPEKPSLRLYGGPRTRTPLVQWYLEELAVPYQYASLDIRAAEHRQPKFLAINPMGKVPAIVDGDFKLWESGAILLYLADKHGKMPESIEERSQINQWVIFANATLGPGLFRADRRDREMPRLLQPLNDILAQQPFILGTELSVADVAVGSYLYFAKILLPINLSDYPAVDAYLNRLAKRPAFQKTLGRRTP